MHVIKCSDLKPQPVWKGWKTKDQRPNVNSAHTVQKKPEPVVVENLAVKQVTRMTDFERYTSIMQVVLVSEARFAVHYPGGSAMMTHNGDFMYFASKSVAISIVDQLKARFGIESELRYGPVATGGKSGRLV